MGDERTDPDHLWIEFLQKEKIISQIFCGLKWRANHKACPDLITDFLQIPKAFPSVNGRKRIRMKPAVMDRVICFMTEQITVSTRIEQSLIAFP